MPYTFLCLYNFISFYKNHLFKCVYIINVSNKEEFHWLATMNKVSGVSVTDCWVNNDTFKVKCDGCYLKIWLCITKVLAFD
jgi:hypothetical protein